MQSFRSTLNGNSGQPQAIRDLHDRYRRPASLLHFPRAVLGLPIVFHFNRKGDLPDSTLTGKEYNRMASPLILRPLACKNGYLGMAVLLDTDTEPPGGIQLTGPGVAHPEAKLVTTLSDKQVQEIRALNNKSDVLVAFLQYVESDER